MRTFIIILAILLFLASCTTVSGELDKLQLGQSYEEVVNLLGRPDGMRQGDNGNTIIEYYDELVSGWSWTRADYYAEFNSDNTLVGFGVINARAGNSPVIPVVKL